MGPERRPAVVHSPRYRCDIGPHVFPIDKYDLLRATLVSEGSICEDEILEPTPAPRADLLLAHTPEFVDDLENERWTQRTVPSELPISGEIIHAYVLAAGGTTLAAREAMRRGCGIHLGGGFHHACPDHAEGFCYVNDVAVALRVLQRDGSIRRAAVVDLDVHQGNGTARIFDGDASVFTLSMHQQNNYPTPKAKSDLDIGLADGTGDEEFLARLDGALERVWETAPEIIIYVAGADPFREDRLGGLALTLEGLETRDRRVLEGAADRGIPSVVTLGGGYARTVEDLVEIHAQTCRVALEVRHAGLPDAPPSASVAREARRT